jgi:hypothetical protein
MNVTGYELIACQAAWLSLCFIGRAIIDRKLASWKADWCSPTPSEPRSLATIARPDTILAWYHKLVARKFSGSQAHQGPGRPRLKREVEQLIIRMASENRDWG